MASSQDKLTPQAASADFPAPPLQGPAVEDAASPASESTPSASTAASKSLNGGGSTTRRSAAGALRRLAGAVPPILVFGLLAAVGYWGHQNHWQVPAFSELTGEAEGPAAAWCAEHGVPEEICVACNADLMPKGQLHGWCQEHGVAECLWEHPELAQLKEPPSVTQADLERARVALETRERPQNDPLCKMHLRRIQFASPEAAGRAGIDIGLVRRDRIVESLRAVGEIRYDPTLVTRVAARAEGSVWRVDKNVGDPVREGELLALVDSVAVGQAKAELLQAHARLTLQRQTVERLAGLGDVVAGRRLQEAEAAHQEADAALRRAIQTLVNLGLPLNPDDVRGKSGDDVSWRLHFLGVPPDAARKLDPRRTTTNLLPVLSPRDGVIVTRDVVAGEVVDPSKTLFTVVDNRRMWLLLDVPLEEVKTIEPGQRVLFRPDGDSREHQGQVTWISTRTDSDTRTVKVRAELDNRDGRLRDESFGTGRIVLREEDQAIVVPKNAIHWEGCCHVAFVRDKNYLADTSYKVFHTRMVRPGVTQGDLTEVVAGLFPGEVVVTKGSGVLRAELLKGNLGAG